MRIEFGNSRFQPSRQDDLTIVRPFRLAAIGAVAETAGYRVTQFRQPGESGLFDVAFCDSVHVGALLKVGK